jgi:hypothetical protein
MITHRRKSAGRDAIWPVDLVVFADHVEVAVEDERVVHSCQRVGLIVAGADV